MKNLTALNMTAGILLVIAGAIMFFAPGNFAGSIVATLTGVGLLTSGAWAKHAEKRLDHYYPQYYREIKEELDELRDKLDKALD